MKSLKFLFLCFFIGNSNEGIANEETAFVIDDSFVSAEVNSWSFKKVDWDLNLLPNSNLQSYFLSQFEPNKSSSVLYLTPSYNHGQGWAYFEINNASGNTRHLTLQTEKIKCDALKLFYVKNDSLIEKGYIKRETPLKFRPYHNFDFALPVTLSPNEKLGILLRSERVVGLNEMNLKLMDEAEYLSGVIPDFIKKLAIMFLGLATALLLVFLGSVYSSKLLFWIGVYLLSIALGFTVLFSFHDTTPLPAFLTLNASSMMQFVPLLSNLLVFPFIFYLKKTYSSSIGSAWISVALSAFNVLLLVLLLFTVKLNKFITIGHNGLLLVSFFYVIYELIVFTKNTRRYYFIFAAAVGLGVNLIAYFYRLFFLNDYTSSPLLNYDLAPFGIVLLAWAGIEEIRHNLITRETYQKQLEIEKNQLEELRKSEIERIGRDLHDNVGNSLASVLGYLSIKKIDVELLQSIVSKLIKDVRMISHTFVKNDGGTLLERIENLIERLDDSNEVSVNFIYEKSILLNHLAPFQEQNLFYIIQEVLINSLKHGNPNEVTVQIIEEEHEILITIEDDGSGISDEAKDNGIGLSNINKRAQLSKFKVVIESSSQGTSTVVQIAK